MKCFRRAIAVLLAVAWCGMLASVSPVDAAETMAFDVTLGATAVEQSVIEVLPGEPLTGEEPLPQYSGRLFVLFSDVTGDPLSGPNWFQPAPFFAQDITAMRVDDTVRIDDTADGFPAALSQVPAGKYRVQAVLDCGFLGHHHAGNVGNLYSEAMEIELDPEQPQVIPLRLTRKVIGRKFPESAWLKRVQFRSERLSQFHRREMYHDVAVVLPAGYDDEPQRRYPVVFVIPGFGGSVHDGARYANAAPRVVEGEEAFIRVILGGSCRWGDHVSADSATNGPRGTALVKELIPHLEATFRMVARPEGRLLTGHSSGGWASLWLQVNWPQVFGGVWSTAPDPVDFRDFQQIDLYAQPPLNMYTDAAGERRPIARLHGKPLLYFDTFTRMDDCLKRGGQLRSFEAVFSPLDQHGQPARLWNRKTGAIDPEVAQAWQAYDIRLVLERNWPALKQPLQGKLRITTGDQDTFYLNGAVARLRDTLMELGSDAEIEIVPGADHSNLLTAELFAKQRQQMSAVARKASRD